MNTTSRCGSGRGRPLVILVTIALAGAAACVASSGSPSPSGATPAASEALASASVTGPTASTAPPSSSADNPAPASMEATPFEATPPPRSSLPPAAYKGPWKPAGTMAIDGDFDAVALADGRVLAVAGTWDPSAPVTPHAQVWDPATSGWTTSTGFNKQRSSFALVGLKDGRALVAGGLNEGGGYAGQSFSSACVFDLRVGHEGCTAVGLMTMARTSPSAILLPDGRVLVAGGYFNTGASTGAVEQRPLGIVLAGYRGPSTGADGPTSLDDVVESPHGYALATAEIFDPATGAWTATGPMRYARVGAPMIVLSDGRVMVVGSADEAVVGVHADAFVTAELYDPRTGRFSLAGRLPAIDHAAVRAAGVTLPADEGAPGPMGTLVAVSRGGAVLLDQDRWWKHEADVVRTFRYDAASNAWRQVGAACASARDPATERWVVSGGSCRTDDLRVVLPNGHVLALGGGPLSATESDEGRDHISASLVDPESGTVTALPDMPVARFAEMAAVLPDGSVLVMGGMGADGEYCRTAVRYAPG